MAYCVFYCVKNGEDKEKITENNKRLKEITDSFASITKNSGLISSGHVNGSIVEMVLEYARMLTHIDLIKFNNMVKKLGNEEKNLLCNYDLFEYNRSRFI